MSKGIVQASAVLKASTARQEAARQEFDEALLAAIDGGQSYGQIARLLDISRATVQSAVDRARARAYRGAP